MISFFIPGTPRSTQTGSVVRAGGRLIPIRRGTAWSGYCGLVAEQNKPEKPLEGALTVTLTFCRRAPKKHGEYPTTRPDVENLAKGLLDSWNGILWRDDSQIVDLELSKRYDAREGVEVEVQEL